jgi:hypothetical protein
MSDLKNVCGTLSLLARQIDQVVNKIDDKFGFIIENLSNNNIEINANSMEESALAEGHNIINCLKRTTNNINSLANNRNFTKIIKNDINTANNPLLKNNFYSSSSASNSSNNCPNINSSGVGNTGSNVLNLIENRYRESTKPASTIYSVPPSACSTACNGSANKNTGLANPRANNKLISELTNLINNGNNTGAKQMRALSDRKPNLNNYNGIAVGGVDFYSNYSAESNDELEKCKKPHNCANLDINVKLNTWNSGKTMPSTATPSSNGLTTTFNGSNYHTSKTNTLNSNTKIKCTRSKSQPAFKDSTYGNYSTCSSIPTSESQKISAIGSSTTGNGSSPLSTLSNAINKYALIDSSRLTSSPICHFNSNSENSNSTLTSNPAAISLGPNMSLVNDNSNPESSFYEDQLDNELESFSENQTTTTYANNSNTKPIKTSPNKSNSPRSDELNGKANNPSNESSSKQLNGSNIKSIQTLKAKSGNSNHHVSFNINNAIYTSRQETPIPISILKQPLNNQKVETSKSNTNNKSSILVNGGSLDNGDCKDVNNSSLASAPIKKTPCLSNGHQLSLDSKDLEQNKVNRASKSIRIDAKTTIL